MAFCSKCGLKLSETVHFCPNCGEKVTLVPNPLPHKTENSHEATDDHPTTYKKHKFCNAVLILSIIISLFLAAISFSDRNYLSCAIAGLMAILFLLSLLINVRVIKFKTKGLSVIFAIVAILLIIPFFNFSESPSSLNEEFTWTELEMHTILPAPEKALGRISSNTQEFLNIVLCEIDKSTYSSYLDACVSKGFTIDSVKSATSWESYNEEGYFLQLFWLESSKELIINLNAPRAMHELLWPTNGLGHLLPAPKSTFGSVITDSENTYSIYVGNTSLSEFESYVTLCEDAGFIVDHTKSEKSYAAKNEDGYTLRIKHIGFNTMEISIQAPRSNTGNDNSATSRPPEDVEIVGVTPSFKEAMDSYEKFFDEYISFMASYADSNDPLSLLDEYIEYMRQYGEVTQKLDTIDKNTLSAADAAYYTQVQIRISQKLLEMGGTSSQPTDPSLTKYQEAIQIAEEIVSSHASAHPNMVENLLVANYGFSQPQAQYGVAHANIDWNPLAIAHAKDYILQKSYVTTKENVMEYLSSVCGFSEESIAYALENKDIAWDKLSSSMWVTFGELWEKGYDIRLDIEEETMICNIIVINKTNSDLQFVFSGMHLLLEKQEYYLECNGIAVKFFCESLNANIETACMFDRAALISLGVI